MEMESADPPQVIRGVSFRTGQTLEWIKLETLGEGAYGFVELAKIINPFPSRLLAVKYSASPSPSLQKEYRILRRFHGSPNIVQCYAAVSSYEYEVAYHNLFLDYAPGGDLFNLIQDYGGKIPESDVRHYTKMILEGLSYIHERGYVHCDIKPENILVYPSAHHHQPAGSLLSTLKIADFGSAKEPGETDHAPAAAAVLASHFRGTANYMSPESVAHGKISAALDIWSLGCVIAEMMSGESPWKSATDLQDLAMKIGFSKDSPDIPKDMSEAGKDFLMRCFARDPCQRWTATRLLTHPFLIPDSTLLAPSPSPSPAPQQKQKILLPHEIMQCCSKLQ